MSNYKEQSTSRVAAADTDRAPPQEMAVSKLFKRKIWSFIRGENGNVAILTVLALAPLVTLSLGALDVYRISVIRTELQGAVDASLLSAARRDRGRPVNDVVRNYIRRNVDPAIINFREISTSVVDNSTSSTTDIEVDLLYDVDTFLLGRMSGGSVTIDVHGRAEQSSQPAEIALVLDVSGSMKGPKIIALRSASTEFIDTVLPPASLLTTTVSVIPFGGTVNLGNDFRYAVDPSLIDSDDDGARLRGYGGFLDHSDGHEWKGCFTIDARDYGPDDFIPRSHSVIPDFHAFPGGDPWCPPSASRALFVSNNAAAIKRRLLNLTTSDGTGMDIGAAIGFKALSPAMSGRLRGRGRRLGAPAPFGGNVRKFMVIMTDGELTRQLHPAEGCIFAEKDTPCRVKLGTILEHRARFERLCDDIKAKGIILYTIGFQVDPDRWSDGALRACPQTPSNYFHVASLDIASVFSSIASSINGIRITE